MKRIYSHTVILLILTFFASVIYGQQSFNIKFDPEKFEVQTFTINNRTFMVRAYENIVYVERPVDTSYQKMNIYVPVEYFEGKSIEGYTAITAPIFFPNKVGGYMPALPASTKDKPMGFRPQSANNIEGGRTVDGNLTKPSTIIFALSKGYIVASAGARGRTSKDANGTYTGKAPSAIVDLKSAIRYLKFNDKTMPGDANKIISNGTSAGGAMSSLLGATGNNPDYEPYLNALGAAKATDDIFAVSAYCPIINLENADMAYEWQFNGINTYKKGGPMQQSSSEFLNLSTNQINVSKQLKDLFPAYVNTLNLRDKDGKAIFLDADGNGNFKEMVKLHIMASAQKELNKGNSLSAFSFLTLENAKVTAIDFDAYVKYIQRQKSPPAFDALDLSSPENMLFGTTTINNQHFTDFGLAHTTVDGKKSDNLIVKMMNPMNYIGQANTATAKHWRIRHGTKDKDTGLAISVLLAILLENKGFEVDFELPWEITHSGDYDLDELFQWMESITKQDKVDNKQESNEELATQWIAKQKETPNIASFEIYPQASRGNGQNGSFMLYLPKAYQTGKNRYPVLYFLHAGNGNQTGGAWLMKEIDAAILAGKLAPIIVVSVQALPIGWYCNANKGAKDVVSGNVEDVIIKDLIPYIDSKYRTIASNKGRGIEGWSMGGFGATRLAYKFPELFGYASSLAGAIIDFDDERNPQYLENTFGPATGPEKAQSEAYFNSVHPKLYAKKNASAIKKNKVKTRILVGDGDWLYNKNGKFITKDFCLYLDSLGIQNTYTIIKGAGHMLPDDFEKGTIEYPLQFWVDAFGK